MAKRIDKTTNPEQRPIRVTFWDRPEVKQAQRCLDCWASWKKASFARCDPPRWEALFPRAQKVLLGVVDQETGLPDWWSGPDWSRADKTSFGILVREPNGDARILGAVRLVAWQVEQILDPNWHDVLLRLYPRSGPYSVRMGQEDREISALRDQSAAGRQGWQARKNYGRETGTSLLDRYVPERLAILALVDRMVLRVGDDWNQVSRRVLEQVAERAEEQSA